MTFRAMAAAAALSLVPVTSAFAVMSDPIPVGAGEVLVQYDSGKPTEEQKRICEKIGGEIVLQPNGKYVCVRRQS